MKLGRKFINKKSLIIVGVLLGTMLMLTGCGKADISVKTYDKENEVETSKIASVENTTDENKVKESKTTEEKIKNTEGNNENSEIEEIKRVIKDTDWRSISGNTPQFDERFIEVTYAKIFVDDKAVYFVDVENTIADAHHTYALTYQNGKVKISNNPIVTEYADVILDAGNGVVATIGDVEGEMALYSIEDGDFVKFAYSTYDGEEHWYFGEKSVSQSYFFSYIDMDNAKEITTENIEDIF